MKTLLTAESVRLYYKSSLGAVRAVDDVSVSIHEGEALGIVGESGCGKSSLALAIMRVLPTNVSAYSGRIHFENEEISSLTEEEFRIRIRWKKISMVFQGAMNSLNPVLKVGRQVAEPMLIEPQVSKGEAYDKAASIMTKLGLSSEVFDKYPHELSGGMKQRVVIAMSLILDPKLVIMDEPTSALDVSIQAQITNLLKKLKRNLGLSVLFITHDLALASDICDRIAVMYAGEIVEVGGTDQILSQSKHPYTQKLLASTPMLTSDRKPEFISGAPPHLVSPPTGCRFHPRCPFVFQPCAEQVPPNFEVGELHYAKCWLHRENQQ